MKNKYQQSQKWRKDIEKDTIRESQMDEIRLRDKEIRGAKERA